MRKNIIGKVIGLIISVAIAAWLLGEMDLSAFLAMVRTVPAWSVAGAFGCYLLLNIFRMLRFRLLLDAPDLPLPRLYPIVLYHNFLVRLLPFKAGEVSYVVLLRRYLGQSLSAGVSSLVTARLFELLVIILAASSALLLSSTIISADAELQPARLIPLLLVATLIFTVLLYYAGALLRWGVRLIQRLTAHPLISKLSDRAQALATAFDRTRQPHVFFGTLALSTLTYSMSIAFNVVLLRGIGTETPFALLIAIISVVMVADALPLATISGLGIIEGGWALGLVGLAGFEVGQAASIGFFLHGCQLLSAIITGMIGYLWLQRYPASSDEQ